MNAPCRSGSAAVIVWVTALLVLGLCAPAATLAAQAEPGDEGPADDDTARQVAELVEKQRAFAYQNTHEPESELDRLAVKQMLTIGEVVGIPAEELAAPKVANYTTFVMAVTDDWVYTVDLAGNQTLRPVCNLTHLIGHLEQEIDPDVSTVDTNALIQHTRGLAYALGNDNGALPDAIVKREVVVSNRCGTAAPRFFQGRYYVRLCKREDNFRYFQAMYSGDYRAVRAETNQESDAANEITELLLSGLDSPSGNVIPASDAPGDAFICGTFFDPAEHRFECDAYSVEGEQFLALPRARGANPYDVNDFDDSNYNFVDVNAFRTTGRYRFNAHMWWTRSGAVGSVRGNWDPDAWAWDRPDVTIAHHCFDEYPLVGPPPLDTKDFTLSDGSTYACPFAVSRALDEPFWSDLEECSAVFMFTHSGMIDSAQQIRRSLDVWVRIGVVERRLGRGHARHLVFYGCSSMGAFEDSKRSDYLTLFDEWLPGYYIDGLRTVCGVDGEAVGGPNNGWHFFRRYNKGEPVSMAFAFGAFDGWNLWRAVTAAYGATPFEAVSTLTDGRFSLQRAEPVWAVASVWRNVGE